MTDSNQNITRKFDLNRKKIKLKIDFDSSLTCYSLDPKSIGFFLINIDWTIFLFIYLFKLSTLNEFIPAPLAETNERSSATEKGTWIDLKEWIMKNLTYKIF